MGHKDKAEVDKIISEIAKEIRVGWAHEFFSETVTAKAIIDSLDDAGFIIVRKREAKP